MNKKVYLVVVFALLAVVAVLALKIISKPQPSKTGMANPASVYCEEQGGKVSVITDSQGGQLGICAFPSGIECDEWKFFRGECSKETPVDSAPRVDIGTDTELIKLALVEKDGIDLTKVDVVTKKDTGKYASGGIKPKEEGVGGAYFFAAKTSAGWKIVASGNGSISCESLIPYPDLPSDMIPECIDKNGNPVQR